MKPISVDIKQFFYALIFPRWLYFIFKTILRHRGRMRYASLLYEAKCRTVSLRYLIVSLDLSHEMLGITWWKFIYIGFCVHFSHGVATCAVRAPFIFLYSWIVIDKVSKFCIGVLENALCVRWLTHMQLGF